LPKRLMQGPELSRAFMLRYDLYRHYFPLMALGRAARAGRAPHSVRPSQQGA
jgi:squalene-hopene/tetraprenyl-beta-curcumene cyclase